jgi:hypothetical protein
MSAFSCYAVSWRNIDTLAPTLQDVVRSPLITNTAIRRRPGQNDDVLSRSCRYARQCNKTTFHEIAHIVLGHTTSEKLVDSEQTARHLREVEAESVALICCETLGLEGTDFCRGYIQHWLKAEKEIPNHTAARIFAAATSILKAGTPAACGQ